MKHEFIVNSWPNILINQSTNQSSSDMALFKTGGPLKAPGSVVICSCLWSRNVERQRKVLA